MSDRLPEFIDPWHFAEIGKELTGQVRLTNLSRLEGILLDQEGYAGISLKFRKGENRRVHITGRVETELKLECQRCLQPVNIPVISDLDVVVVEGFDEATMLADELDPLLVGDKRLRLSEVVEEELLLALPQVPMHPEGECKAEFENYQGSAEQAKEEEVDSEPNPFAVLRDLKK